MRLTGGSAPGLLEGAGPTAAALGSGHLGMGRERSEASTSASVEARVETERTRVKPKRTRTLNGTTEANSVDEGQEASPVNSNVVKGS